MSYSSSFRQTGPFYTAEGAAFATSTSIAQTGLCEAATGAAVEIVETVQNKLDAGEFVGATGPNSISASTATNITGLLAGSGTNVSAPTAAQVGTLPIPDAGGYFADDTIDGAFQSLGADANYIDPTIVDLATFTDALILGGGGKLLSRTGVNPVDDLAFEINGSYNALYNTFLGRRAGNSCATGNMNTFVGVGAGELTTNGDQNVFVGKGAGYRNTSGYHNTFLGNEAGENCTTGYFNTYVGCDCCLSGTGGFANVAMGASTFTNPTTAHNCVAIGNGSLDANTTGICNTAVGSGALHAATINYQNSALGYYALAGCNGQYANNNAALGYNSGNGITSGAQNVFLGAFAGSSDNGQVASVNNAIAIGYQAIAPASNTCQIGNASITKVYSHGDFEAQDVGDGFICKSPDGTRYRITVANGGTIAVTAA